MPRLHSTTYLTVGPSRPVRQDFFTVGALVRHLRWVFSMKRQGASLRVRVVFPHATVPYWRVRRAVAVLWASRDPRYTVVAHSVAQGYGGPEEGGWWYQTREVVERRRVWRERDLEAVMEALVAEYPNTGRSYSVLGGEDFRVRYYGRFTAVPDHESDWQPYC